MIFPSGDVGSGGSCHIIMLTFRPGVAPKQHFDLTRPMRLNKGQINKIQPFFFLLPEVLVFQAAAVIWKNSGFMMMKGPFKNAKAKF